MPTQKLVYQCPSCNTMVEVDDVYVGEVVSCASCHQPFRVEGPSPEPEPVAARPVALPQPQPQPALDPDRERDAEEEDEEQAIKVTHPAMFRQHPIFFIGCATVILGGLYGAVTSFYNNQQLVGIVSLIAVLIGVVALVVWWIRVINLTLTVTTRRTILRQGIIAKRSTEVQHDDVRNIQMHQTVYQRLIGIGDIQISSAAQGDVEISIRGIPDPDDILSTIRDYQ